MKLKIYIEEHLTDELEKMSITDNYNISKEEKE
jgi:hypothetical protein